MKKENFLKISIVVAIYNVENYIRQCVESLLGQTYQNLEIVLVEDGSPDHCSEICDQYEKRDHRVKVIHQKNQGLSVARNEGIKKATGDYVLFVDGDDFFDDENAVQKLAERVQLLWPDVLNYSYTKFYENEERKIPYFKNVYDMPLTCTEKNSQLEYITKNHLYIASACNKMVSRKLFTHDLEFVSGIFSEDIEWCARLLKKAETLDFICMDSYCYRQRKNSITHSMDIKKCTDLKNNIIAAIIIADEIKDEKERNCFYRYAAYQYGTFIINQAYSSEVPKQCIRELKSYRWILSYHGKMKKIQLLDWGTKVLGMKGLCRITRIGYRLRGK